MSVRYYISQVLPPDEELDNRYRVAIFDATPRVGFSAHIPTTPDGIPAFPWALAFCKGDDFSGVDADPRNIRLFDGAEGDDKPEVEALIEWSNTARWSELRTVSRNRIRSALAERGVPVGDIAGTTSMRAILQKIGRFLDPNFNELRLFVR